MALNMSVSPIYHTSPQQKIKAKNAAYKYKFGSPKIRDILREKCHLRLKESRRSSFDGNRNVNKETFLKKILKEELADLENNINLQELIYQEILEEAQSWFVEDLENEETYLINTAEASIVFCPVCQKSELKQLNKELVCCCGTRFVFQGTLKDFHSRLNDAVRDHENTCNKLLSFFTEPVANLKFNKLNALCNDCDYFRNF